MRHRHAHARRRQPVERVDLGALPSCFGGLPAELGALGHRALQPRILHLAVLGVVDGLAETALGRFLVDLGAARLDPAAHHVDHGLLAAHELPNHAVDQSFVDECL